MNYELNYDLDWHKAQKGELEQKVADRNTLEARVLHLECVAGALQYELDSIRPQAMKYLTSIYELDECKKDN